VKNTKLHEGVQALDRSNNMELRNLLNDAKALRCVWIAHSGW